MEKGQIIQLEGEELRRYQMCVLDIAKDFVQVCDSYGLSYSLSGGSILGAIRHGGFIPWDDDIDINITRASYDRLLEIFDETLGDRYDLQTPQNCPEIGIMVTQIRKKGTVARRKYDWNLSQCGVSIDLYIIENVFENPCKRKVQQTMSMACAFAISAVRDRNNRHIPQEMIRLEGRPLNYTKSKRLLGALLGLVPLKTWIRWCDYWNKACRDTDTPLVAIPTGRKHFSGEIYERSEMCVFRTATFEGEQFHVPIHAEAYLERFYGDYMKLPPVEKRERHLFLELSF